MVGDPNMKKPTNPASPAVQPLPKPLHSTATPVISAYDHSGFVIDGLRCAGGVTMLADKKTPDAPYAIRPFAKTSITPSDLDMFRPLATIPHVMLIGIGETLTHPHYALRKALQNLGLTGDIVPTPAACRTWNLLLSEGRILGFIAIPARPSLP